MKFPKSPFRPGRYFRPSLLSLIAAFPAIANPVLAGGYFPERRNITVTALPPEASSPGQGPAPVAEIEIDNNLPGYQLVLEFHALDGDDEAIDEVRLESLGGTLGRGLSDPSGHPLDGASGRYVWNPGRQETATLGYRVRVMVTYKRPVAATMPLTVGMSLPF